MIEPTTDRERIIWAQAYTAGIDCGIQIRIDEEAARPATDPNVLAFGRWWDQALEREKHDADTRRLLAEQEAAT